MAARQNLHDISAYRGVLDAANVLSAERGPASSVLGEPPLADPRRPSGCTATTCQH